MHEIIGLLREYHQARAARQKCENEQRVNLTYLAKLMQLDLGIEGAEGVIAKAEIAVTTAMLRQGEVNKELLSALKAVYAGGAELEVRVNAEVAAVKRLREALLALPNSPGRTALREDADCEAYAAHVICHALATESE